MQRKAALRSSLSEIKRRFGDAGIEWAIFAGAAAFCYGSMRDITDIDVLVKCEDLVKAKDTLNGVDLEGFDVVCGFEIRLGSGSYPFFLDREMMQRVKWKKLFNVSVPILSVEDNIILKAILQRGREQDKRDVEDIKSMIAHEKVDLQYLTRRIQVSRAEKRVSHLLRSLIPDL